MQARLREGDPPTQPPKSKTPTQPPKNKTPTHPPFHPPNKTPKPNTKKLILTEAIIDAASLIQLEISNEQLAIFQAEAQKFQQHWCPIGKQCRYLKAPSDLSTIQLKHYLTKALSE